MIVGTLNIEGLNTALANGLTNWFEPCNPDLMAFQEIWSLPRNWTNWPSRWQDRFAFWNPSTTTAGTSGTAILTRKKPDHVTTSCGISRMDDEGRWLQAEFATLTVVNVYLPYFWTGDPTKDRPCRNLLDELYQVFSSLLANRERDLLIIGDFNIAPPEHRDYTNTIDAADPSTWPYKKIWMHSLSKLGLTDIHPALNGDPETITWLNRKAPESNLAQRRGTRIDYHLASTNLSECARKVHTDCTPAGRDPDRITDHCAVLVDYEL